MTTVNVPPGNLTITQAVIAVNPDGTAVGGSGTAGTPTGNVQSIQGVVGGTPLSTDVGPYSYSRKTADGQVKGSAGFLHLLAIAPTGSVVAGVLTIYDALTETGTVIFSTSLPITTFTPLIIPIDVSFATGLFIGFDATLANVQVLASYR
jgi:hypothetical protein